MRLNNKVAIIVGAGQKAGQTVGNGRATAITFAREGAKLVLVDRDEQSLEESAKLARDEGATVATVIADWTMEADCERIVQVAVDTFGRIDILHNNVGIGTGDGGLTSVSEETWHSIMDTNLTGAFLICKHVLPQMRKQGDGCITNISSGAAVMSAGLLVYKVSKAGLNALTHFIAMGNARHGIRANAIMPGLLDTPMAIESHSDARDIDRDALRVERDKLVPLRGKMGDAWDTANAALFLASDEARFITGAVLPVDGGQSGRIGL